MKTFLNIIAAITIASCIVSVEASNKHRVDPKTKAKYVKIHNDLVAERLQKQTPATPVTKKTAQPGMLSRVGSALKSAVTAPFKAFAPAKGDNRGFVRRNIGKIVLGTAGIAGIGYLAYKGHIGTAFNYIASKFKTPEKISLAQKLANKVGFGQEEAKRQTAIRN
ncbi:MAG TPA: hypothetical protein VEK38_04615 [Candidatus Bathyarchaeia archaeon]|nr:hypothetical protein [Candidatus Bathyarchaeia archaeon]